MENQNINHPIIVPFLDTVREYCSYIEKIDWNNAQPFINVIYKNLVRLYKLALELPPIESDKSYADTLEIQEKVLDDALQNIKKNAPFQYYWTVLNPLAIDLPSTGTGDLIDDLFDIYKELKLSITYYDEVEGYREFGLWLFNLTFSSHWGDHCVDAIHVIHKYLAEKD